MRIPGIFLSVFKLAAYFTYHAACAQIVDYAYCCAGTQSCATACKHPDVSDGETVEQDRQQRNAGHASDNYVEGAQSLKPGYVVEQLS